MTRNRQGNINGRRQTALKYLEAKLAEWNSHDKPFENHKNTRSHEAEKARIEREIANVKAHLHLL